MRLKLIKSPTLILWGRNDDWIPVTNAKKFLSEIPNAQLKIMEETGHIPMEERPLESVAHILKFLNRE